MADYLKPGPNEFSAEDELAMRLDRRAQNADPALLAQVAPEFAPAAANEAREDAAARIRSTRAMPRSPREK